jgi:hypothetical protein
MIQKSGPRKSFWLFVGAFLDVCFPEKDFFTGFFGF